MKNIIIALLLVTTPVSAATVTDRDMDFCAAIGEVAENVMTARQRGASITELLKGVAKGDSPQSWVDLVQTLAMLAYEEPRWSSERTQQLAIQDFSNSIESECLATVVGIRG